MFSQENKHRSQILIGRQSFSSTRKHMDSETDKEEEVKEAEKKS